MNTKILERLGKQLRLIRKEQNLTQEQLAEKIGVHPTYVGEIEGGKSNPLNNYVVQAIKSFGS